MLGESLFCMSSSISEVDITNRRQKPAAISSHSIRVPSLAYVGESIRADDIDKRRGKVLGLVYTSQDERCTFSSVAAEDGLERSHGCMADWILTMNASMAGYRCRPELGRVHKRVDFAAGPA